MKPVNAFDFQSSSLQSLAKAIRCRAVRVDQVAEHYLSRVAVCEPRLSAFAFVNDRACRIEAHQHDVQITNGRQQGSLQGIPIAVKDVYAVAGMPMHLGSDATLPSVSSGEGPFIDNLRGHAPLFIGKTAMTELSLGTVNLTRRQPWNPVDPILHRTAGGSSGGSAVAVAGGLCMVALGTDTGGSVRQPAAMCGVVGYKSSYGIWDMSGIFPLSKSLDSIGVFTRTVGDLEFFLAAILHSNNDFDCSCLSEPAYDIPQQMMTGLDECVAQQFNILLETLSERGVQIAPLDIADLLHLDGIFNKLVPAELIEATGYDWYLQNRPFLDPVSIDRLDSAIGTSAAELDSLRQRLKSIQAKVEARMRGGKLWLSPTTPSAPVALQKIKTVHDAAAWNILTTRNTRPINAFGQCAISLPMQLPGFDLPIGVQVVASHGNDRALLRAAAALEDTIASIGANKRL